MRIYCKYVGLSDMNNIEHVNNNEPACCKPNEQAGSILCHRSMVIGLTGGIATGKSTVAAMFKDLGANVVDADAIVHQMLRKGEVVWQAVVDEFGNQILLPDNEIDRRRLGDIVFNDPTKRARLEAVVHPPVIEYLSKLADQFRAAETGVLILEIPLLVELSLQSLVDKVLVVTAEQETQVRRLINRYGIDAEQALIRIRSQMSLSEKSKFADWIISTEGTLQSTREQVSSVWDQTQKALAQRK